MTEQNFQTYKEAQKLSTDEIRVLVTTARKWNPNALNKFDRNEVLGFYSRTLN
jgi:hypothetical protein